MSSSLTVCQYAVVKKETRSEWLTEISNYGIFSIRLLADKAANYFRHGLMLLWFTDLMDVTEEVTIPRPNISTYLPFLNEWKSVIKTCKQNSTLRKASTRYPISDRTFTANKRRNTTHLLFTWKFEIKVNLGLAIACAFWES